MLTINYKSLFCLFVVISNMLSAQNINPRYNFKNLNVQNGLVDDIVYHFLHDSKGYIWLGTRNGISIYDGMRTVSFQHDDQNKKSLSGNFITGILEDTQHRIWVGTNAGIDLFEAPDNSFTHFSIDMPGGQKEYLYCALLGFANPVEIWFIETQT